MKLLSNLRNIINNKQSDYFILLIVLLLGMWQIVFGIGSMKWDFTDIYLPWKFFITECLKNQNLPLWNPYTSGGFPQMGDPGTWYPISWIIGFLYRYNLHSAHFEFILHLYIAAVGMYKIAKEKGFSRTITLIMAISYMFSGFFISNAQHIGWLISAAWLPFVFLYFNRLFQKSNFINALKFAFVLFLMLSGGYPGIFIPTIYLLAGFYIFNSIKIFSNNRESLIRINIHLLISTCAFVIFSLVVLLSSTDLSNYIARAKGLNFDENSWGILTGSLSLESLITFLFPFAGTKADSIFWKVDFSMVNIYIGLVPLLILIYSIFLKNCNKNIWINILIGIIFLMIALAKIFPFREWLLILPFMNLFRFSALFRLFSIFFFVLAVGYAINHAFKNNDYIKSFKKFILFVLLGQIILIIFLFIRIDTFTIKSIITHDWHHFLEISSLSERILFQSIIHFGILSLLFLSFQFHKWHKIKITNIVCFIFIIEIIISVQLNIYSTIISEHSPKFISKTINSMPKGYPSPIVDKNITYVNDGNLNHTIPLLWRNLSMYHKVNTLDGYTPYSFESKATSIANNNYNSIINNPLLFLTSKISDNNIVDTNFIDKLSFEKISVLDYSNNQIIIETHTKETQYLVFLQNYHHSWKVFIEDKPVSVIKLNDTFMGIHLPQGKNIVTISFKPKRIIFAAYISIFSWIIFILLLIFISFKTKKALLLTSILTSGILLYLITYSKPESILNKYARINPNLTELKNSFNDSLLILINSNNNSALITKDSNVNIISGYLQSDYPIVSNLLSNHSKKHIAYFEIDKAHNTQNVCIIKDEFSEIIKEGWINGDYFLLATKPNVNSQNFKGVYNSFENLSPYWQINTKDIDSSISYTGCCSYKITADMEFSCNARIYLKDFNIKNKNSFLISAYIKGDVSEKTLMVLQITRNNKTFVWDAIQINSFNNNVNEWNKVYLFHNPIFSIHKNDIVDVYFWNINKHDFWVDDVSIKLY